MGMRLRLKASYGTSGFNQPMVEGISVNGINPTGFTLDFGAFEEVSVGTAAHGPRGGNDKGMVTIAYDTAGVL